jgi:putative transposase
MPEFMKKLNLRKIRWIIREREKGELSAHQIAKLQGISERWVRQIPTKYAEIPLYKIRLLSCGRKPQPIPEKEKETVLKLYEKMPMGATKIELYLRLNGKKHIPHNRIHRILASAGKVQKIDKKIRRKKWVRYQRPHSNSLWHTDFCEVDGEQIISFIDDASRFVVGGSKFADATTDNALLVLEKAIAMHGKPKQVMTDHGAQFCSDEEKIFRFSEKLKEWNIEHIMAAVKRPQSNGKIERWFGTAKKLYFHFGKDLDKTVACYNRMPHLSLDMTPAQAYEKKRNS